MNENEENGGMLTVFLLDGHFSNQIDILFISNKISTIYQIKNWEIITQKSCDNVKI